MTENEKGGMIKGKRGSNGSIKKQSDCLKFKAKLVLLGFFCYDKSKCLL